MVILQIFTVFRLCNYYAAPSLKSRSLAEASRMKKRSGADDFIPAPYFGETPHLPGAQAAH
jgi:hypothetical protein